MIVGRENVISWLKLVEAPYWTLYLQQDMNKKVAEANHLQDNLGIQESLKRLNSVFDVLSSGTYTLIAKMGANDKRAGVYREVIEIEGKGASSPATMAQIGSITRDDISTEISKARKDWENELELKMLREKLKEREKEPAWIGALKPTLEAIAMKIAGQFLGSPGATIGVTGFPTQSQPQPMPVEIQDEAVAQQNTVRIQAALEQMDNVLSPQKIEITALMEKLAALSKNNPANFLMYVNMLMGMQV